MLEVCAGEAAKLVRAELRVASGSAGSVGEAPGVVFSLGTPAIKDHRLPLRPATDRQWLDSQHTRTYVTAEAKAGCRAVKHVCHTTMCVLQRTWRTPELAEKNTFRADNWESMQLWYQSTN